MLKIVISIIAIILTVIIVVGFHELGHFIVARLVGVKVLRFSIGFGKAIAKFYDRRGTEYVIAPIPLGGYVKLLDEREGPVNSEDLIYAYNRQPYYKKLLVVIAGPLFNLLLAFILYWLLFIIGFYSPIPIIGSILSPSPAEQAHLQSQQEIVAIDGRQTPSWIAVILAMSKRAGDTNGYMTISTRGLDQKQAHEYSINLSQWIIDDLKPDLLKSIGIVPFAAPLSTKIGQIKQHSPAMQAGLKPGDQILKINQIYVNDWPSLLAVAALFPEQKIKLTIKRYQHIAIIDTMTGSQYDSLSNRKKGYLGLLPDTSSQQQYIRYHHYSTIPAITQAYHNTSNMIYLNFLLLGKLITGKISVQSLGGPITLFEGAGLAFHQGIIAFISFLAYISIAIGAVNILPIPGLDGGHALLQTIESLFGRPISLKAQIILYYFGMGFLIAVMTQALVNDILRI